MRRALLALAAVARVNPQLVGEPTCFAPADTCGTTPIGLLLDASSTAAEAAAVRAAVVDINADINVLPHTQLVLHEPNISEFASLVETHGSEAQAAADAAEEAARALANVSAVAAVGATRSSHALALLGPLHDAGIPLVSHSATAAELSDAAGFARVVPPDSLQSRALARIVAEQDWARVGILHCGDEYCQGLRNDTVTRLQTLGLRTRLVLEREVADNAMSVDEAIDKLVRTFGNDTCAAASAMQSAVLVLTQPAEAERLLRRLHEQDLNLPVRILVVGAAPNVDPEQRAGVMALRPAVTTADRRLLRLAARLNVTADDVWPFLAYDAAWAVAHSLHAAHAAGHGLSNASAVTAALARTDFEGVTGTVELDAAGDRPSGYDVLFSGADGGAWEAAGLWAASTDSVTGQLSPADAVRGADRHRELRRPQRLRQPQICSGCRGNATCGG